MFSNAPPWKLFDPLLEIVVMSLTPPNSAELLTSLTRISAMELKAGNISAIGPPTVPGDDRIVVLLIPSTLTESMVGLVPATEMFPLASVCTPGWLVRVERGLVEPPARVAM